jgi:hypothetical protein
MNKTVFALEFLQNRSERLSVASRRNRETGVYLLVNEDFEYRIGVNHSRAAGSARTLFSKILLASLITLGCGASVQAQSIYRCGQDSAKTYSDRPCVDGQVVPKAGGRPTDAERAEAQKMAERERKLADDLEQNRLSQEHKAKSGVIGMDTRMRVTRSAAAEPVRGKKTKSKGIKLYPAPSASKPTR